MLFYLKRIKSIIYSLIKKSSEDDVFAISSQLAYSLLLSFFPFLIFLISIVSLSNVKVSDIMNNLRNFVPTEVYGLLAKTITEVLSRHNGSILSISLVLTLWSASTGLNGLMKGLNKAYNEKECRNFIVSQIVSITITIALAIIIILVVFFLVFGEATGHIFLTWIGMGSNFQMLWHVVRYIFMLFIMAGVFSLLYIYAPCKKHNLKSVLPGAILSSLGWIVSSLAFSFYINNFSNYSRIYGSLGAVIILMLWLLVSSFVILIGGELNSVLNL